MFAQTEIRVQQTQTQFPSFSQITPMAHSCCLFIKGLIHFLIKTFKLLENKTASESSLFENHENIQRKFNVWFVWYSIARNSQNLRE